MKENQAGYWWHTPEIPALKKWMEKNKFKIIASS